MAGVGIDLFKEYREDYRTPKHPTLLVVSPARYLALEGQGPTDANIYQHRLETILMAAEVLHKALHDGGQDYQLGRLQCQWWSADASEVNYQDALPRYWKFRLLIRVPDFVTGDNLDTAAESLTDKARLERIKLVQVLRLEEGLVVQMLHNGTTATVGHSMKHMREFAKKNALHFAGPQHEIYLSDATTDPALHKTIIRRPVR